MRKIILLALVLSLNGCGFYGMYMWAKCGDGGCPRHEFCPIEKRKVDVEFVRSTTPIEGQCGRRIKYKCLHWTQTLKCENGHVWKVPVNVRME